MMANDVDLWNDIEDLEKLIEETKDLKHKKVLIDEYNKLMGEFIRKYIESD